MCEIQIIQKLGRENINKADLGEFFKMMCFGSMHNSDAFGVFNEDYMFKERGAFNASKLDEYDLTNSNFIIGHNRFSTPWCKVARRALWEDENDDELFEERRVRLRDSKRTSRGQSFFNSVAGTFWGRMYDTFLSTSRVNLDNIKDDQEKPVVKKKKTYNGLAANRNHHPFKLGDFTLMHNGVISNAQALNDEYNFQTTISTDSYVILELIDHFFNESRIKDRVRRIAEAIQKTCKVLKGGYSVLLYDKKGKNTFYFKNIMTSFSLCKYEDKILCGSTSPSNLEYLYFGMEREEIEIKNKRVYLITSNAKSPVIDVTPYAQNSKTKAENKSNGLHDILTKEFDYETLVAKLNKFLEKTLGFVPYYKITWMGDLKISRNNEYGIREKIHNIAANPRWRFGWYLIKSKDMESFVAPKKLKVPKVKKVKEVKNVKKDSKIKLKEMKGGKK